MSWRSATSNVIDTFFRTELAEDRPANSKLLVYWSGHGYVMNDGTRIFICRDYTEEKLHNRVFNASNFRRYLRSAEFGCFRDQILIVDVCGTYGNELRFSPDRSDPGISIVGTKQTMYFATPEGKYALGGAAAAFLRTSPCACWANSGPGPSNLRLFRRWTPNSRR